jgi:hypothetical protein
LVKFCGGKIAVYYKRLPKEDAAQGHLGMRPERLAQIIGKCRWNASECSDVEVFAVVSRQQA